MREVEAELEDGSAHPILLVRNGGDVTALGAKCTHYQFPLAKGVLSNGTIRCPLHGACFNAQVSLFSALGWIFFWRNYGEFIR